MRSNACSLATAAVFAACVAAACGGKQEPPATAMQQRSRQQVQRQQQAPPARPAPPPGPQAGQPPAQPGAASPVATSQGAQGSSSTPPAAMPSGQTVGTSGVSPAGGELGVGDNDVSGVQVALLDVRRTSGDTVTVKWQYRNTNPTEANVPEVWLDGAAKEAYLLDSTNRKKYMVLRDASNETIAERHNSSSIPPGGRVTSWAKFPAPPPDVTKVTVMIPHVAPFEDVPIR